MLKDEIYKVYENMGPDEAARDRMLKNIRSAVRQKEFVKKGEKISMRKKSAKLRFRFAVGVAAGCLLVGTAACAVYHFRLKEVDMISLAGVAGSPEHEADVEWQAFLESYDQDESILAAGGNSPTGFEEEYGEYLCYSQEMADKIDEICEKYGLQKLTGFELPENYEGLCSGAGVGDFLGGRTEEAKAEYMSGWFFADGSFEFDGCGVISGSSVVMTDYQFSRAMKGTFQGTRLNVGNLEEYEEWNYTTKNGETVLLATNGSTKALIIAEREKSFVTVNVLGDVRRETFGIGEEELEKLAEAFDFSVIP